MAGEQAGEMKRFLIFASLYAICSTEGSGSLAFKHPFAFIEPFDFCFAVFY